MRVGPLLEQGQTVLVAPDPSAVPHRMTVDLVQDNQVTLASFEDEPLPREWRDIHDVHLTTVDRFNVHLIHVPIVHIGKTRLVVGEPDEDTPVQRRAYARIFSPVPLACLVLDPIANQWHAFDADVRDLGGGGCSLLADAPLEEHATVVCSISVDDNAPVVAVARVLPREPLPTIGRPLVRLEFVLLREADRDRILRFVLMTLAGRRHDEHLQHS